MSGRGRGRRGAGGSLSDRFTQLQFKANTAASSGRDKRRIITQQTQTGKRQALQNATRFGGNPKKAVQGVRVNVGGRGGGRGGGLRGRGGRGRGRGGRGGRGEKKPDKDALDMELDEYHFKAGKGPDPKQAKLDKEMEDYWKSKKSTGGDGEAKEEEEEDTS